jgi:hypothetical protein
MFCPSLIEGLENKGIIEIPISIEARSGLLSADVWLKYDPACLEYLNVSTTNLTEGFNLADNGESRGLVKIALYGTRPVTDAGAVLNIQFRVADPGFQRTAVQWEKIAFNEREFHAPETLLGVPESGSVHPKTFGLKGNYPNPFNPGTTIEYASDSDGEIRLAVFDMQGRKVRELVRGWRSPGEYKAEWDGKDDRGLDVPTGLYFCRLEGGGRVSVVKMLKTR